MHYSYLSEVFDNWLIEKDFQGDFNYFDDYHIELAKLGMTQAEFIKKFVLPLKGYTFEQIQDITFVMNHLIGIETGTRVTFKAFKANYDYSKALSWLVFFMSKMPIPEFIFGRRAQYHFQTPSLQCEFCGKRIKKGMYCPEPKKEQLQSEFVESCHKKWKSLYNRFQRYYDLKKEKNEAEVKRQFIAHIEELFRQVRMIEYPIYGDVIEDNA